MIKKKSLIKIIREMFTKDIPLKVTTLIMSLFFYIYVGLENREEKTIKMPLVLTEYKQDLSIGSDIPKFINVTLLGGRNALMNIDYSRLVAKLNLVEAQKGPNEVVPYIDGYIPSSVRVVQISPDRLVVEMEAKSKKFIKVEPEFIGDVVSLGNWSYTIRPDVLLISGPKTIINDIAVLRTQSIDIKKILSSVQEEGVVKVDKVVKLNNNISPYIEVDKEKDFTVTFRKNDGYVKKNIFDEVKINFINLQNNLELKETKVISVRNIVVNIQKKSNNVFKLSDLYFYVDLSTVIEEGNYRVNILNSSSEDVAVSSFSPQTVDITVILKKEDTKTASDNVAKKKLFEVDKNIPDEANSKEAGSEPSLKEELGDVEISEGEKKLPVKQQRPVKEH